MADDTQLNVGVVIDTSDIDAGTARVSDSVQVMADRVKAAFGSVEKAPEGVQNALRVMANASTQSGEIVAASAKAIEQALEGVEVQSVRTGTSLERAMALGSGRIASAELGVGMLGNSLARVGAASTTLGPLLAAAFPVFAAVALVSVVTELVDKYEKLQEGIRKAIIEGENLDESSRRTAEGLELENVKLEIQIDKLENRPTNNKLAAALLEAQLKADQLGESLQNDIDKATGLLNTGFWESLITSFSVDEEDIKGQLQPFLNAIQEAKISAAKAPPGTSEFTAAIQREKDAYGELASNIQQWIKITDPGAIDTISKLENAYGVAEQALKALNAEQKNSKLEVKVGNLEDVKSYADLMKKLNREVLEDSKTAAREELEETERDNKEKKELATEGTEWSRKAAEEELEQIERTNAANKKALQDYTREKDEELRVSLDTAKKKAEADIANIGPKGGVSGLNAKKAELDAEYEAEREAILKRIGELDPQQVAEAQKLSDQIVKIWETMQDKKAQLDERYRTQLEHGFQQIVGGPLDRFVDGFISGQERIGVAFQRLGQQLVVNLLESLAKMGLAWAEHWALVELETALGLSTTGQMNAAANIKTILNNAYVAASNAYADVPFPFNLVVAPAVFAAVAALGGGVSSAAGGMVVPNDMLAMVHQNEVVLPASISKKFLDSAPGAGGGRGGGGDVHVHVHAVDAGSFRNSDTMKSIKKELSRHARGIGLTRK